MVDSDNSPKPVIDVTSTNSDPLASAPNRTSPQSLVYGGTASTYEDVKQAKKRSDADRRRAVSDNMFAATRENPDLARMRSRDLSSKAHVIIAVMGDEKKIVDWLVCDITVVDENTNELMILVPCPACVLKRQQSVQDSIMQIRQSNRGFTLDMKNAGKMWINPKDSREVYLQAGSVSTHEAFRCDNGCHTRYQIDNNVIRVV